jgi:hypothetical protein
MSIVLSIVAAGALGSLSASSIVDAKRDNQKPDTEGIVNIIKSIKARISENDETQRGIDKKDIWKEASESIQEATKALPRTEIVR